MAKKSKRAFDFYPLEDRILLSGDGLDGADASIDAEVTAALMADLGDADGHMLEDPAVAAALVTPAPAYEESETPSNDFADAPSFDPALPLEVVFVDAGVEDSETLLAGLRASGDDHTQWRVIELAADQDGIEQITAALNELSGVDAIHILSHGDGRGIQLGDSRLDVDSVTAYAGKIASWAGSLDADADLLIYGCDLASTDDGRGLIDSIGALCDCDVAASDDATGHESLGGDWDLEYATGVIDTDIAFGSNAQNSWQHILATYTVTNTNDSGAGSLRQAILDANANSGADTIEFNIALTDAGHVYYQDDGIDGSLSVIATTTLPDGSITDFDPDYPGAGYSWYTIDVQSALPIITDVVTIDATTQPGFAGVPIIELNGSHDGSNIAAGRRVQLPWGANNLDVTTLTTDGQTIMRRSLEWAGGTASPGNVLLVVDNALSLNTQDLAKKSMMEGWGFTVSVIDSGDSQAAFDAAVAVNDVAFISEDISAGDLGSKLRDAPIGVVAEEANLSDVETGTASAINWDSAQTAINIDDNSHYITSTFSTGTLTVFTSAESMAYISGTTAPDLAQLGSSTGGTSLFAIDAGQELYNGTSFNGLHITGNNSLITGLVLNRFDNAIFVDGGDGNVIQGNYIGTDVTATHDLGNSGHAIYLQGGASNNTIGGDRTAGEGNVVSGNNTGGIYITGAGSDSNVIQGNLVGVDASGTMVIANSGNNIDINLSASGNLIGGTGADAGNVIGGGADGITIWANSLNIVQSNFIGTDITGTLDLGNLNHGIAISGGTTGNLIGGINPNEGNVIAFNGGSGIGIWDPTTDGNTILGNSIYRNHGLGIDIGDDGITPNDPGDGDSGPNNEINTPVFTTVSHSLGSTTVDFEFDWSGAAKTYRIEFFVSDIAGGSGQTLVHTATIAHGGGGVQSFSEVFATSADAMITATATTNPGASFGSTSEFSTARNAQGGFVLVVDTTSDVSDGDTSSTENLLNNRGADGFISLREAIEAANATAGVFDIVQFDIDTADSGYVDPDALPGSGDEYWVIAPTSVYVDITDSILIDATSQRGYSTPVIELDGTNATGATAALRLRTSDSTIRGFAVHSYGDEGFEIDGTTTAGVADNNLIEDNWVGLDAEGNLQGNLGDGILVTDGASFNTIRGNIVSGSGGSGINIRENLIAGTSDNIVVGNYVGTDTTGTLDYGNAGYGIEINQSANNVIGGTSTADRNIVSGNDLSGISIWFATSTGNVVQGNYIGTDVAGSGVLGNANDGIRIGGGANANTIGGNQVAGAGNVISANLDDGIELNDLGTDNNLIYGNFIGTNATGTADLGNARHGVVLYNGVQGTQIGGTGTGQGNVISGNDDTGIIIDGNAGGTTTGNVIQANYIGTDITGAIDLGNTDDGIRILAGAHTNTIGGTAVGAGNLISGNDGDGVDLFGSNSNTIEGNFIGIDVAGTSDLGNSGKGVRVASSAANNIIGGTTAAARNVISGNDGDGIRITVGSLNTQVMGNYIGTDVTGTVDIGNTGYGVLINSASFDNTIGGTAAGAGNLISGNDSTGVSISGTGTDNNLVLGNYLGTDVSGALGLGNSQNGVLITSDASNNDIGDGTAAGRNIISGNLHGITISGASSANNRIRGNYIGTDVSGTLDVGNTWQGINAGGLNTIVGGIGAGNVISGNNSRGIYVNGATGLVIQGNYIGTNAAGSASIANSEDGINIISSGVQIGGTTAGEGNVISGNAWSGISLTNSGATGNTVEGNIIGLDATGTTIIGNGTQGVNIASGANNNKIGGTVAGARNIISGNTNGVYVNAAGSDSNVIAGNYIGTDITGTVDLGNTSRGIYINGAATTLIESNLIAGNDSDGIRVASGSGTMITGNTVGLNAAGSTSLVNAGTGIILTSSSSTTIGGTSPGAGNLINAATGNFPLYVSGSTDTTIEGNLIGTDAGGTTRLNGGLYGIMVFGSGNTQIGGATAGSGNVIAGYSSTGIYVTGATSTGTAIQGNAIGTDAGGTLDLTTGLYGIDLQTGATGILIGGTATTAGNRIAFNTNNGIRVNPSAGNSNSFHRNLIYSNGGIGIDLGGDGITTNDLGDGDSGTNDLTNFAVIYDVDISGGNVTITGEASAGSTVEFFIVADDGDTHGEASGFIGSGVVAGATPGIDDPAARQFSFVFAVGSLVSTDAVTATVTDTSNNTSEFAANVDVENAPTDIAPNSFSVDEWIDTSSGYSVGGLTSTDADVAETFTYSVVGGADQAKFSIGGGSLDELILTDGTLDFETQSSYSVTVRTTDSTGRWYEETLTVNVNDRNDAPNIATNTGMTLSEGSTATVITTAMLDEGDVDDSGAGLTYTITNVTDNGTLYLAGFGALGLNDTFTQADIDAGNVTYDHDGSETTSDSFDFSLADGGEDGATPATGTFNITVTPVNDEQSLDTNLGLTLDEGAWGTITATELATNDVDNTAAQITYAVDTTPINGTLYLNGVALSATDTFTQADINGGLITYHHNAGETTTDSFSFTVDDSAGTSTSSSFNFTVNPVNDAPVNFFTGQPQTIASGSVDGATDVKAADLNGDGDIDLISSSYGDNRIVWYENDGAGNLTAITVATGVLGAREVFVADVNNDGHLDILSAAYEQQSVIWYENDGAGPGGTPTFSAHTIALGEGQASTVFAADLDNDGDMDVLAGYQDTDEVVWYENDGLTFTRHVIANNANAVKSVVAGDLDGDGDIDVASVSYIDDKVAWYENDGALDPTFTQHVLASTVLGPISMQIADVNGDGNQDLVVAAYYDGKIAWYQNDGSPTVPIFTENIVSTSATGARDVAVADLDNDGDADIISAAFVENEFVWYESDGGPSPAFAERIISLADGGPRAVAVADMDGDSDLDVIGAAYTDNEVGFYENTDGQMGMQVTAEETPLTFNAANNNLLWISDSDAAALEMKVRLEITSGTISLSGIAGLTLDIGTGTNDSIVEFRGSITDINAALDGMTFTPTNDFNGIASIRILTDDQGHSGSGGALTDDDTINITVTPVNDSPTVAINTGATVLEGSTGTVITTAMLNEGDVDDSGVGLTYTITNVTDNGTIYLAGFGALGLNDTFTQADIDAGNVTYDHDDSETTSDAFGFSLADGGEDGSTPATGTFNITVTPVNDNSITAMSDSDAGGDLVLENASVGTAVGVTAFANDDDAGDTVSYSLDDNDGGRFAIDSSTGVVTVAAAIDREADGASRNITVRATSSDGSFTDQVFAIVINPVNDNNPMITSDGGGASASINVFENDLYVSTVAASDADLPAETLTYSIVGGVDAAKFAIDGSTGVLTFVSGPDFESPTDTGANNVYDVVVQVSDGTFADTQSIAVTVNDVADSGQFLDRFDAASYSNSDGSETWTASWVEIDDGNPTSGGIKVSQGELKINGNSGGDNIYREVDLSNAVTATLDLTYDNGFTGSGQVLLQVSGNGGANYTTMATLDSATNFGVGSLSYDISSYIATDTRIRLYVSGSGGGGQADFDNIQVSYVPNTAPTITSNGGGATATLNVSENSTAVTTVTTSDPDVPGQTLTYSIIGGADAGLFSIDSSSGVLTLVAAPNHESPTDSGTDNVYDVTVQVSDGIDTDTQAIAVTVIDVDEFDVTAVSDVDATANAVDENAANGTIVGVTASASDADSTNNTISYSLDDNAGGRFAIDGTTGVVTVADGTLLDRESAASHNITVRASSSDGSSSTAVMTINLSDVDEFDVGAATDTDGTANNVNENATLGTLVGIDVAASDDDATNNTITYSLANNDGGRFTIDASTGVVTVAGAIDRETDGASRNITVRATSSDSSFTDQVFAIAINDVDEFDVGAVTDSDGTANAVDENAANGTVAGVTALASDDDATNNTITYSLDDNAGGRFAIDGSTGVVTVADGTLLDREAAASHNITVRATSSDGSFSTAGTTISVNGLNDNAPVITSNGGGPAAAINVLENSTAVTTVTAFDADLPGQTISYSIVGGADAAKFSINSSTGELTFVSAPDFESPTDADFDNLYDVSVQASDGAGGTDTQALTVSVQDLRVTTDSQTTGSTTGSGLTVSHTSSGDDRLMLVSVSMANPGSRSVSDISYNGTMLTFVGAHANGSNEARVEVWALVAPDLGAHDVVVTLSGANSAGTVVGVTSFTGVDQTTPLGTFASAGGDSSNPGVNVSSGEDELVYAAITIESGSNYNLSPGSGQSELWDLHRIDANSGASVEDGAASVNMSWSFGDNNQWAVGAISIRPTVATNFPPTIISNGGAETAAINLAENVTTVTTVAATDADLPAQTLTYSIAGGDDAARFSIDSSTGELTLIASPDFESPLDSDFNNVYEVTVQVSDGNGGSDSQAIIVTISDVDEFDVGAVTDVDATTNAVAENSLVRTAVGITAAASDADGTNNTITYSLQDNDGGRFAIDSNTGVVTVSGAIDRETDGPVRNITVRATSADGSFTDRVFAIGIDDVDEFDVGTITDSDGAADTVAENASIGTSIGITALASDADATNNTILYTLDDDAGGRFAINGSTGEITVNAALDYESNTSHSIVVRAASSDGSSSTQGFTISVTDVSEFGATAIADTDGAIETVAENASIGTAVGVTAFSDDADGTDTITYSLDNNDGARFTIDSSTGIVTVAGAIDREADGPTRNITVRATSTDGSFQTRVFTISITDVDEFDVGAVTDSDVAVNAVAENSANGTVVGVTGLSSDDDATNNAITYTLDDNAGGRFAIDSSTGVVTVADGTLLDREAAASHNITVRATSADGSFNTAGMTINVVDVDEFDVGPVTDTDAGTDEVAENVIVGTTVGITADAFDLDATNNTITYSLTSNPDGFFTIDANTGVVSTAAAIDRENHGATRSITVQAASSDGSVASQSFNITINDVDEFDVTVPTDVDGAADEVTESVIVGTTVGITADAFDLDATTNTITYSLTSNPDGLFTIDANTGVVTTAAAIDRETHGATRSITVQAASSDGSVASQSFNITINDVDEFDVTVPADVDAATDEVTENVIVGTTVGITADAFDLDATTNTITYSLTSNPDGLFTIDANTGVVTTAAAIDRETHGATRSITVQAASSDGSVASQSFNITINDVDEFDVTVPTDVDGAADEVTENVIVGTTVGITADAFDLDATNNTITYSLTSNPDGLFTIDANTGVVTTAAAIDRETHGATRSITVQAASSDGSVASQSFNITINDVDEFDVTVPTDVDGAADEVTENVIVGTTVGITADAFDLDATNNTITYSLTSNPDGLFTIDANTGVVSTAAVIDRETHGATRSITVQAASSDGSVASQSFNITINDVDEFDVTVPTDVDAATDEVTENVIVGTTVGITADAFDLDATTNTITYSLTSNPDGLFTIDANTGVVTTAAAIDRETHGATRSITVQAASSDGSVASQSFNIAINDVDEFDVGPIADSDVAADTVAENAGIGTSVGMTALASDADATNNTIVYTLDDDAGGRFAIDGSTGEITVNGALDYETNTSHNVIVRASSSDGSSSTQGFTINVSDVSESGATPIVDNDGAIDTVAENSVVGTTVGVTAFSDDADGTDTITYSLDDNDGGRFAIDSTTGIVTVAGGIDREADGASRSITVRATSTDGSFQTRIFTIAIDDVDEFDVGVVSDTDGTINAVDENAANGTVVGVTALASDADATNNTILYTLDDNAGGRFAIDGSTGIVTVADGTLLDREAAASHNITVRATSSDGSFNTAGMTINVNDVDEFDVGAVSDTDGTINAVNENAVVGTAVGVTASASDADATTNAITYSLQDNDGGRFAIDSSTGIVTVAGAIDREADGASRNITVRATSADGSFTDQVFAININDVDEFDVGVVSDTNGTINAVDENAVVGTTVGVTASASDADATTNTITYTLQDNDGGRFAIDSNTGIVTVAGAIDREADGASRNITVRATSADGSFTDQVFAININDVDEFDVGAVSDTDGTINAVDENAVVGTAVGVTASASDADATTNAITYSLQDNDGGRFAIDSSTGIVTVAGAIDREADGASRNITVRATSADGSFTDQVFAININDVDEFNVGLVTDVDGTTNEVDENAVIGTAVGITASASDVDATTNTITYSLQDNDGGRFAIDSSTGIVTVAGAIDREADGASRNITVRAISADGSFTDQVFAININDLDEFDVGAIIDGDGAANTVNENATIGTTVGITASASDVDATTNTITYSLQDNDGGRFTIDSSTGVVTVAGAIDREADGPARNITVRVTSADGSFTDQVLAISINDVDEFDVGLVTDIDGTTNQVDENATVGTTVGIIGSSSDADATNNTITYSLDDNDGGRFAIDSGTGIVTVAGAIDREADGASRNITVRSTSSDGSFATAIFTIGVGDIDEFDATALIDSDVTANVVNENSALGTIVGLTAFSADADATDTIAYSLDDNAGGRFAIDGSSGVVTVSGSLDFESASSHNVTVRATSTDGSVVTQVFTINVADVNEAPAASADDYSITAAGTLTDGAPGVLVNDADPDGDALMAILVTPPNHGTVTLLADGTLSYTPSAGFFGIDTIQYQVSDGFFTSNVVTIEITVIAGLPSGGGDPPPDPDPVPDPDPTPDPEPEPEKEPADDESDPTDTVESAENVPTATDTSPVEKMAFVTPGNTQADQAAMARLVRDAETDALARGFYGESSKFSPAAQPYSAEIEMLGRLLQLDLEQAIIWQQWDERLDDADESPISYFVGTAGTAAGLFSIGYVLWALRGGAFVTAMASSLPAWRLIDPAALLVAYRSSAPPIEDRVEKLMTR